MSDYLKNLVERTLDPSRVVQPRLASRFEPHGTFAAFDLETQEGETDPAAPPFEAHAEARHADATPHAESAPPTPVEHFAAPSVFEGRPESPPREPPPAPPIEHAPDAPTTAKTLVEKEAPRPTAASVEAGKSPAREETSIKVFDAKREPPRSPESGPTQRPRVVEPRLSPLPKVFEAQPPRASADEAGRDEAAPTIRVTIGRVDVRAVAAPAKEARRAPAPPPRPALTLEDYLRRRGGGSR
ncbi:MAG TPA: hypothetical protein VGX48_14070 [Pyrinomonadaceae bacterium]|jgi:hypothetical protein|nr:hypothetical protein [Pyrinomonadaceae bacterium]